MINSLNFSLKKASHLPVILQNEIAECGHACVTMICNYWGHQIDLSALNSLRNTSIKGITLFDISHLLQELGFRTRALRVNLDDLKFTRLPAILHWNMNHFVVLKKVTKNYVIIHDPATGVKRYNQAELSQHFTGIVLEVEKSDSFKKIINNNKLTLYHFMKMARGINKFIIFLILLSLSIEMISLLNPLLIQYVTDDIIGTSNMSNLYMITFAFLILILLQSVIEYSRSYMIVYLTSHLTEKFSASVVTHLLRLPLDFFSRRHKGDIQSKFQTIDHIQKKISTDFINTMLDGFMVIMNLAVMIIYSLKLTLIICCNLLLFLGIRYLSYRSLKNQTETSVTQHARAASVFLETLQSIVPIKTFAKENGRFKLWHNSYIQALNADIRISRLNNNYDVINQLVFHIDHIAIIFTGALLILTSKFSTGMLVAFLSYRLLLINKASSFIHYAFDYKLISIQLNRLSDIVLQEPELVTQGRGQHAFMKGNLQLSNLSFRYDKSEPFIFNKINLTIKAGEKIAITGPSGCGKSTLLKVMMGLLSPQEGEIYIDGMLLSQFGLKNYRELTASVMQEDCLLAGSILENISFFAEEINLDYVYQVAQLACIHDTIMGFPMGYETQVGEMGSVLSGGQKQRILLARALYKKPKLLFLDEATSHLDIVNEININQSLKSLAITQIIIAHRQETIQMADRVIQLDNLAER
ncbi:ABC transporter [Legionella beliardensis]|uniref:ABC transporter n=1 Tax=Legionella beliardensis TaxID=91822 RepID=A0A378I3B3_9GAMM|nr:peptidase domain-containing ABC transporter [Legionella beliardensis]STX29677.1 ABC transporter [Legionella beliardensis]